MPKVSLTERELTHVQIASRAFEIDDARSGQHGYDVADWFEAERQLKLERPPKRPAVKRTKA